MPKTSQTTLSDLQGQQYIVQHQIRSYEDKLQQSIRKYSMTPQHDLHHAILFAESYYLNELLGYLREQHSLISRYIVHLEDQGPGVQWDRKAFWDYPGDQGLKVKCLETVDNPYFARLWLKEIHFIAKSYTQHKHQLTANSYYTQHKHQLTANSYYTQHKHKLTDKLNSTNPQDPLEVVANCQ